MNLESYMADTITFDQEMPSGLSGSSIVVFKATNFTSSDIRQFHAGQRMGVDQDAKRTN
jgi:hypothetical protein